MTSETRSMINVQAKGDKLLVGNDFHVLEDKTSSTFKTNSLKDFLQFLKNKLAVLFIDEGKIEAYLIPESKNLEVDYYTVPSAVCRLVTHSALMLLINTNNKVIPLNEFSLFLDKMKEYLPKSTMTFRDNIKDLKIKKVFEIENKNDGRGNFAFSVRAESGKQDYIFPEQLKFNVPLISYMSDYRIDIPFDLYFDWDGNKEDGIKQVITIKNFELGAIIEEAKKDMLQKLISTEKDLNVDLFYGCFELVRNTDQWKYSKNELNIP